MKPPHTVKIGVAAVLTVIVVGCAAFFMGFDLEPSTVEPNSLAPATLWQRMCRAAGVVTIKDGGSGGRSALPGYTQVVVPRSALTAGTAEQLGRGATLALRCSPCHGAQGLSGANAPNLAGQYAEVVYKQLLDYKSGARVDAVMGAMVAALSEQNMLDLAHYYAFLPRTERDHPLAGAPALVRVGDPMRSIAPCASCHGRTDGKVGAPALDGEPRIYLQTQLTAFAGGLRRNDANAVMRGEARLLTAAEITAVTDHYAGSAR
jgi:cytochrome c553